MCLWCNFLAITCKPGNYLIVENSTCELCPVGTAAPGNVYVVNSWTKMPSQFFSDVLTNDVHSDCSEYVLEFWRNNLMI